MKKYFNFSSTNYLTYTIATQSRHCERSFYIVIASGSEATQAFQSGLGQLMLESSVEKPGLLRVARNDGDAYLKNTKKNPRL
jgi:hypothetical protein